MDMATLKALAVSFEQRAEQAREAITYTRSGYLTRDSVGLQGMGIAFDTAARELREALEHDGRSGQRGEDRR